MALGFGIVNCVALTTSVRSIQDFITGVFFLVGSLLSALVIIYASHQYPAVTLETSGLRLPFFFGYLSLKLAWAEIESVKLVKTEYRPESYSVWIVITKRLTPLHRLYGKFYVGFPDPSFVIHSAMIDHRELITAIEQHLALR